MLRRLCHGGSFAEAASLHFQGRPRVLRVWDEAFLPSSPATIRKDTLVSALEELRPIHPAQAEALEALAAPLEAASDFQAVEGSDLGRPRLHDPQGSSGACTGGARGAPSGLVGPAGGPRERSRGG